MFISPQKERQTVYEWRKLSTVTTLPGSGLPVKMTVRAQCIMLNEVKKNPRVSAKDFRKSLTHATASGISLKGL